MLQDCTLSTSRTLPHSPATIYAAFASADLLASWWGPEGFSNTFEIFDFKPGGRWKFVMHSADGKDYANESVFTALEPAAKVLPRLREWFVGARVVGWKYELAGSRQDAFDKAWRQLEENRTDACVLNGAAYGPGFALCLPGGHSRNCADDVALGESLLVWLQTASQP